MQRIEQAIPCTISFPHLLTDLTTISGVELGVYLVHALSLDQGKYCKRLTQNFPDLTISLVYHTKTSGYPNRFVGEAMPLSPFIPTAEKLPATIPIFPLENAVVMPQAELPLNIFEPRYLNMVNDSLATQHLIGMVQPNPGLQGKVTPLYRTGCAGRITSFRETSDGRILISLTGVCRFDIGRELPSIRGYRLVEPLWNRFLKDLEAKTNNGEEEKDRILGLLKRYFKVNKMTTDWSLVERFTTLELVHTMTTLMPLDPAEKQAILEAETLPDRTNALCSALEFGLRASSGIGRH